MPWGLSSFFSATALVHGVRSTVLNTLSWMMLLLIAGMVATAAIQVPWWMPFFFAVLAAINFLLFIGAYVYFGITDKDALRSERYSIQKLAIERGLIGDSTAGLFEPGEIRTLSDQMTKKIEHKS